MDDQASRIIYLDNAATSWPKPPEVSQAMMHFMRDIGANPGRSGHRLSVESGRLVYSARDAIARLLNVADPLRVVFGPNATDALNLALHGLLQPGQHVITSSMEHNSVMRPLRDLEKRGIEVQVVRCSPQGNLDPKDIRAAIKSNTAMVVLSHASNVIGTLQPIKDVGQIAREHDLLFLVDAAQTAGAYPIDIEADRIDLLAFSGHKSLQGPMGTGGLVIGERVNLTRLTPLKQGGTGSRSEHEDQPSFLPDLCESGTLNAVGLAGLEAGVRWVLRQGVEAIRGREVAILQPLIDGLQSIDGVIVYGGRDARTQTATVSFRVEGIDNAELGLKLDEQYAIMCRTGLHCAPAAHRTIGTFPEGTVRFGLGAFNTLDEVEAALAAVAHLAGSLT